MKRSSLVIVLSLVFLEWLDFTLYLYLAKSIFAKEFFPPSNYSVMLSFALFAAAYLARPLGGWFLGLKADLNGRRKPMIFSAALMGSATLAICILPNYAQIGILATWGLLVLRMAQGFAIGGEINTSGMFLVEHSPHSPLVAGSFVAMGGALGMFTGGTLAALTQSGVFNLNWRYLFALVGMLSLLVCRLRKRLQESPEFKESPVRKLNKHFWQQHRHGLINIAVLGAYVSVTVYVCNVYWVAFAIDQNLWSVSTCSWVGSCAQFSSALIAFPIAFLSKPKSNKKLLQLSMLLISISAPSLFYATQHHYVWGVIIALCGYILTNGLICAALFYFLYLQLPAQYRCQGVATTWGIAASMGAMSLPFAEHAVSLQHMNWMPGSLVSSMACIALLTVFFMHVKE